MFGLTETRTDEDPQVPKLNKNRISRLEALGYGIVTKPDEAVGLG